MRHLASIVGLTLLLSACDGIGTLPEPPVLRVTSPERSLIRDGAGTIMVAGTTSANVDGSPVTRVTVNGVDATVGADGSFTATLDLKPGATLIQTEAFADDGGKASDTRSVEAGELRAVGANIERAISAAVSREAFAQIAAFAGETMKTTDFKPIVTAMNPVAHTGDEDGEDCLFGRVFVDDVNLTNAAITLEPVAGGLKVRVELDGLDIPGRLRWAASCYKSTNDMRVRAERVVVAGTLKLTPDSTRGFKGDIAAPVVTFTNLDIDAEGIPGWMEALIEEGVEYAVPKVAGRFMTPMLNKALGGLDGPKQIELLGKTVTLQVAADMIEFTSAQGLATLDMKMLVAGSESSKGFIYTVNSDPTMDAGNGVAIGLADDLANHVLSQLAATGMLNVSMPAHGGSFDEARLAMTSPPMISADPADGTMRVILPDVMATFALHGAPVGKVAINAKIDLAVAPASGGYGVALQLGTPAIYVDTLDDVENQTMLVDEDLSAAVALSLGAQIESIKALLGAIPLPALAGVQMKNVSVGGDDGYVLVKGEVE